MPFLAELRRELTAFAEARRLDRIQDALEALARAQRAFDAAFTAPERLERARASLGTEPYVPRLPALPDESADWNDLLAYARALARLPADVERLI